MLEIEKVCKLVMSVTWIHPKGNDSASKCGKAQLKGRKATKWHLFPIFTAIWHLPYKFAS